MAFDINLRSEIMEKYKAQLVTRVDITFDENTPNEVKQEMSVLALVLQEHAKKEVIEKANLYVPGCRIFKEETLLWKKDGTYEVLEDKAK